MCVEPDKMAKATNVDLDQRLIRESDLEHRIATRRTTATGLAFPANGMKPERINRFGPKRATEEFEADGTPAATIAFPKQAVRGANLRQRGVAARTDQIGRAIRIHSTAPTSWKSPKCHATMARRLI